MSCSALSMEQLALLNRIRLFPGFYHPSTALQQLLHRQLLRRSEQDGFVLTPAGEILLQAG